MAESALSSHEQPPHPPDPHGQTSYDTSGPEHAVGGQGRYERASGGQGGYERASGGQGGYENTPGGQSSVYELAADGPSRQSNRSKETASDLGIVLDAPAGMGIPSTEPSATPASEGRQGRLPASHQEDQGEQIESRPGTGKWLQQRATGPTAIPLSGHDLDIPYTPNTTQPSDPLLNSASNTTQPSDPLLNSASNNTQPSDALPRLAQQYRLFSRRSYNQSQSVNPLQPPIARGGAIGRFHEDRMTDDNSIRYSEQSNIPPSPTNWQLQQSPKELSRLATQLYIYAYLIFFAIFGTLARLGVQWITFYPGAPLVTDVTWANVGGSFLMGFLSEDRQLFSEEWGPSTQAVRKEKNLEVFDKEDRAFRKSHGKVKKTIPLYVGLATGFCGSFTSFSSFQRDVFLALSNNLPTPDNHPTPGIASPSFTSTVHRNGGYSFMALLAVMLYTVALSLGALWVGAHVATALDPWTPSLPFRFTRKVVDRVMLILGPGCWLGAVFLAIWPPDRPDGPASRGTWANEVWRGEVLFALVFAPLGCILRYLASQHLNGIRASFPLGTFAVNIFGCAVEAMCYDIQHVPLLSVGGGLVGGGRVGCQVLQGLMDGFCGCLTTVSTWVAELEGLRRRHAYVYGLLSLSVGLGIMVIIMGSVRWSVGWSDTACVTSRTVS